MKLESLDDLLVHELRDLYSAESQIIRALPKMIRAAFSHDLQDAFLLHLEQTRQHAQRLEQIFKKLSVSSNGTKCKGMEGLLAEGSELIREWPAPEVADAGLIAAAQRVEHYEIAAYGAARTFAHMLGRSDVARALEQTLEEEKDAVTALTSIAEGWLNGRAVSPNSQRLASNMGFAASPSQG